MKSSKGNQNHKNRAVFLDRDGVINADVGNLRDLAQLRLLPRVAEAIKIINRAHYLVIVVTNQPVVARGWLDEDGVVRIHQEISKRLANKDAKIERFYFCPHHPNASLEKYRVVCECRKPETALFEQAIRDYDIDKEKSFVVGDTFRDIEAGTKLGIRTIGVGTGSSDYRDSIPKLIFNNLIDVSKFIVTQ